MKNSFSSRHRRRFSFAVAVANLSISSSLFLPEASDRLRTGYLGLGLGLVAVGPHMSFGVAFVFRSLDFGAVLFTLLQTSNIFFSSCWFSFSMLPSDGEACGAASKSVPVCPQARHINYSFRFLVCQQPVPFAGVELPRIEHWAVGVRVLGWALPLWCWESARVADKRSCL